LGVIGSDRECGGWCRRGSCGPEQRGGAQVPDVLLRVEREAGGAVVGLGMPGAGLLGNCF